MPYADPNDERIKASRRKHYRNNREQYYERNRQAIQRKMGYLRDLKESTPCEDCGDNHPHYVMEFDHRDPSQKTETVSRLSRNSWKKLKAEVAKCDIVCANCHRKRTWEGNHQGANPRED